MRKLNATALLVTFAALIAIISGAVWVGKSNQPDPEVAERAITSEIVDVIEQRKISNTIRIECKVFASTKKALTISDETPVTSVLINDGDEITAGQLIGSVGGRPLFVLEGNFKLYRPLARGDNGEDVVALQTALKKAGYRIRDSKGTVGADTIRAVHKLYKKNSRKPTFKTVENDTEDQPPAANPNGTSHSETSTTEGAVTNKPAAPTTALVIDPTEIMLLPKLPKYVVNVAAVGDQTTTFGHLTDHNKDIICPLNTAEKIDHNMTVKNPKTGDAYRILEYSAPDDTTSESTNQEQGSASTSENPDRSGPHLAIAPLGQSPVTGGLFQLVLNETDANQPVVPLAAITGSNSAPHIVIKRNDTYQRVPVNVILVAEGFAAIAPTKNTQAGDLAPGTQVVLGR